MALVRDHSNEASLHAVSLDVRSMIVARASAAQAVASPPSSSEAISLAPRPGTLARISVVQNLATVTLTNGIASTADTIVVETEKKRESR